MTYLAELRRLASTCDLGEFLNKALCDRLVCGLREKAMQQRLLAEPRLNLKRALELFQGIKAAQKDAKEIQSIERDLGTTNRVGQSKNDTVSCSRCLGMGHMQAECKYRSAKCNKCYHTGHLARAWKSESPRTSNMQAQSQERRRQQHGKQLNQVHHVGSEDITKEQSLVDIIHAHSITPSVPQSYKMPVEINGSHLIMELDTGAAVSIVSETTWSEHLHSPKLEPSSLQLQRYPDRKLQVLGCCIVGTKIQNSAITVDSCGRARISFVWQEMAGKGQL